MCTIKIPSDEGIPGLHPTELGIGLYMNRRTNSCKPELRNGSSIIDHDLGKY